AATAASTSCSRVRPQILMRVRPAVACMAVNGAPCSGKPVKRYGLAGQAPVRIVLRAQKVQAIGREGGGGGLAAARVEHLLHPFWRLGALANHDQAAHDVADHVVQEGA